ncbi:nucleoside-diphosphate sugar epimerase [Luteimonas marina]|uniref:Nucleoside-diphosphate sugar epimerase n=1 Tax=Luteimonas marina TaxID=488485 RepID=A0A5C5TY02_9GAMM|nr:nucleoside-diphosphate sugar epimerase [Luteimonas marina]
MITNLERAGAAGIDSPQIWSLSDGRAGNARQADALADALGGAVRTLSLAPRAPWRWFAPRALPAAGHAFGAGFADALAAPPALAIGCGRQAALATRLLRARGAAAVQILDPRIDPTHWDLVVAPEHDGLAGDNVVTLLGSLNPVDDAWLQRARDAFAAFADLPSPRIALLVGGPTAQAPYDGAGFDALCARIEAMRTQAGGSVLATTSRRTPPGIVDALRRHFARTPGLAWCGPDDGPNPYPGLLAWADRIVCTPDSVNMVSEACATRAPVHVFNLERARARPRRFLDALLARGRIGGMDDEPAAITPLRETARVAEAVRVKLGVFRD